MKQTCSSCSTPKANLTCRSCEAALCKACAQFVDVERFSFYAPPANEALAGAYCLTCFETEIAPEAAKYDGLMARAKDITVFFTEQGKETRLIKRSDTKFSVERCADRDETILRLAFFAAKAGFDTLVDIDLIYEKRRDGSFKIAHWKGTAVGAKPDPRHLPKPGPRKSPSR
ncbi:MAG: B-box zinc finger protein [Bdellovibrionota bacterium]